MASPPILSFDELLAPIAGDNPAGIDLRIDRAPGSPYDKIKDARATARELEKRQERGEADDKDLRGLVPAWRIILDTAPKVLAEKSKDLEITAFLIEALLRLNGLAGLRDGFRLARGLVEGFWEGLYPLPDEDGVSTRVAPLTGLNGEGADGTLVKPLRVTELSEPGDDGRSLTYDDYLKATRLLQLGAEDKAKRVAAGDLTLETFEARLRQTKPDFYRALYADLRGCLDEFARLGAALDAACGQDAPPSSSIRGLLEGMRDCLQQTVGTFVDLTPPAAETAEATAASPEGEPPAGAAAAMAPAIPLGAIMTRDDAFQALGKVADYFRKFEPQSLVSYVIDEAIRRARLPLPELVRELIPDEAARKQFFILSGVRPPEAG
jgi:type VI secretion system protein ImpA